MALSLLLVGTLAAFLFTKTSAIHLSDRQAGDGDVEFYTKQLRSALQAIDGIRNHNASEACADMAYAGRLDEQGYDGKLAQTLLCEEAAGIHIFPDIDQAQRVFGAAYDGLTAGSTPPFGPDDDQSFFCEGDGFNETTYLDNAGLDGPSIRDIVCPDSSLPSLASSTASTLQTLSGLVSMTSTQNATASEPPATSLNATSQGPPSTSTSSSFFGLTTPVSLGSRSSSSSTQPSLSTLIANSTTPRSSAPSISSISTQSPSSTSPSRTPLSSETRPPNDSSALSTQSPSATTPATTAAPNPLVVIVTTFVTVTVNAIASPSTPLPPSRSTLESRIVPTDEPAPVTESTVEGAELPTWTLGAPLSFVRSSQSSQLPESLSDVKLEIGTSLTVSFTSSY